LNFIIKFNNAFTSTLAILVMYGSSWWISFLENTRCDWFETLKCEKFEAWKSGKPISIQAP